MRRLLLNVAALAALAAPVHAQYAQQTQLIQAGVSNALSTSVPQHPFTPNGEAILLTITGSATCTVQVSGDPLPFWPNPGTPTHWNNHDVLVNQTASANSNIAYPVTAVRLNCASVSGTAVLTLVNY